MPTIGEYNRYAVLAQAAYVNPPVQITDVDTAVAGSLTISAAEFASLANNDPLIQRETLPISLSKQWFDPDESDGAWTILNRDGWDGADSGFSATLFLKDGEEKVLAMRGTEAGGPADQRLKDLVQADLFDIGFRGLAIHQAVSMVNYILRLMAPSTKTNVAQFTLVEGQSSKPAESSISYFKAVNGYAWLSLAYVGKGIGAIAPNERIVVTGHSLGGHLAALAARLFPGLVSEAYTYNAPGFDPPTAKLLGWISLVGILVPSVVVSGLVLSNADQLTEQYVKLFDVSNALPQHPAVGFPSISERIHAITAEDIDPSDDNNLVSSDLITGSQPAARQNVAVERNSHDMGQLTDSLRIHSLLASMNSSLSFDEVATLYRSVSPRVGDTQEKLVEELYELFTGEMISIAIADAAVPIPFQTFSSGDFSARGQMHEVLNAISDVILENDGLGFVSLIADDIEKIVSRAKVEFGVFYALSQLNPFAISGADSVYMSAHKETYAEWQDLVGWQSENKFSEEVNLYLNDRAKMLALKIRAYLSDRDDSVPGESAFAYKYIDKRLLGVSGGDLSFTSLGRQNGSFVHPSLIVFGSDSAETLTGGDLAIGDHLYGGGGSDFVDGQDGKDYLEGNSGDDTLIGGPGDDVLLGGDGFDTYIYADGDDFDTITDSDGAGRIQYNGRDLTGGVKVDEGVYEDAFGVEYIFSDYEEEIGSLLIAGEIYVEDYSKGDLGLSFDESSIASLPPTTVTAHVYENRGLPVGFNSGDVDDLLNALYGSVNDDLFLGSSQLAALLGRSGNDVAILDVDSYGIDVDMGAGDDFIDASSSAGSVLTGRLAGGAGNDYLLGGGGNDIIWGDNYRATRPVSGGAEAVEIDGFIYNTGAPFYGVFSAQFGYLSEVEGISNPNLGGLASDGTIFSGALDGAIAYVVGIDGGFDDFIDADSGDDFVVGGSGSDHILGGDGNDRIWGDYGGGPQDAPTYQRLRDSFGPLAALFGLPGDDFVDGGLGDDFIADADGGDDVLSGGEGNDTIYSAEGFWTPADGAGAHNVVNGGAGNDVIELHNDTGGFDVVDGGDGDDQIQVYARRFEFDSDDDGEIDVFGSTGGRAFVFGGSGNDVLNVSADDALVDGGSGDDDYLVTGRSITISDPSGEDTVRLPGLFDHSTFDAFVESLLTEDETAFPDQRLSVFVTQDGGDLVATLSSMVDEVLADYSETRFRGWFDGIDNRIEHIVVSDGFGGEAVLTSDQLSSWGGVHIGGGGADELLDGTDYADLSFGRGGDDLIATGADNDRIYGGTGNDELYGGAGDDIYYYAAGDGDDLVYDISGFDEVRVGPGLIAADVGAALGEAGIVLTIGAGKIGVVGGTRSDPGIDQFCFADGSTVLVASLLPADTIVLDETPADDTPVVIVGGDEDGGGSAGSVDTSGDGDMETSASPRFSVSPPDSAIPLQDASYDFAGTLQHGDPYLNAGDMHAEGSGTPQTDKPVFGSISPDSPAPLDMQSMLDAIEVFDATAAGLSARQMLPARETSQSDPVVRSNSALTTLALTNALLLFHLEQSDARGVPDGAAEWFQQTDTFAGIGVASGLSSFGPTSFGRQAPGLATFAGLQEGFTRLA